MKNRYVRFMCCLWILCDLQDTFALQCKGGYDTSQTRIYYKCFDFGCSLGVASLDFRFDLYFRYVLDGDSDMRWKW